MDIDSHRKIKGLYVHVPFCLSKCDYCGFYSIAKNDELEQKYLNKLSRDMNVAFDNGLLSDIETIFIGGGNPTSLSPNAFENLISLISSTTPHPKIREWTFETNPETLADHNISQMKQLPGIRLSIGVQRLEDRELTILGRRSDRKTVFSALDRAFANFSNISCDFILGVPGADDISQGLANFLDKFPLQHISAYFLTLEEDTKLETRVLNNELPDPDDIGPEEMLAVQAVLKERGFEHYEISNYAQSGYRCQHNMIYWNQENYLGFGPSAVGTIDGVRKSMVAELSSWLSHDDQVIEKLDKIDLRNEYLMLHLRLLKDGLNLDSLAQAYGIQSKAFFEQVDSLVKSGELEQKNQILRLTQKGLIYANSVISELFL